MIRRCPRACTGMPPRSARTPRGRGDRRGRVARPRCWCCCRARCCWPCVSAPPAWRHGALSLAAPWWDARAGMPYAIDAVPGSVSIGEGADLALSGVPRGFRPEAMTLVYRAPDEAGRRRLAMVPVAAPGELTADAAADAGLFGVLLPAVSTPLEYYIEGETVTSALHRVEVRWLPASGELVLDGERRQPLATDGDALVAGIDIGEATRYRVELLAADGRLVAVTPDHPVTELNDMAPSVSVVSPSGETRVTAVEEMQIAVRASDDVSLRHVELVLSVNGGPEEVIELASGDGGRDPRRTAHGAPGGTRADTGRSDRLSCPRQRRGGGAHRGQRHPLHGGPALRSGLQPRPFRRFPAGRWRAAGTEPVGPAARAGDRAVSPGP